MRALHLVLDNANFWANFAVFLLLIALAFRGARRHRRWSLALIGASIALWTGLVTSQWIAIFFGNWDIRTMDPHQVQEFVDKSTKAAAIYGNLAIVSGGFLCVGLALENFALIRGLKAAGAKNKPAGPPPAPTGGR